MNYVGFSYGTVIGAVYAQMFPDRVGKMVLDSPVDLSATPLEELRGNSDGFEQALERLPRRLRRAPDRVCSTARAIPPAALPTLETRFEHGLSLPIADPVTGKTGKRKAGVATFYTALISALYDKQFGWPFLAGALNRAARVTAPISNTWPTATTGVATTAPTRTSTR